MIDWLIDLISSSVITVEPPRSTRCSCLVTVKDWSLLLATTYVILVTNNWSLLSTCFTFIVSGINSLLCSPYGIGQTIIFSCCYLFFFFPRLISAAAIGCLPYFHTWCGLSANLRCMSETCCTRLAENTGRKSRQKSPSGYPIAQLCRAISSQRRHVSAMGKKAAISPPHVPTIWWTSAY